jgi:hypothetical protein
MYQGAIEKPPTAREAPTPSIQALRAGAQTEPTAQPPDHAITITPDEDLQAILDASTEGAWIVLSKGLYTLSETLKIPNNLTLSGQGLETVLFLDPEKTGPALTNAHDDLNNFTLRDLVIEGALKVNHHVIPTVRAGRTRMRVPAVVGVLFLPPNMPIKCTVSTLNM